MKISGWNKSREKLRGRLNCSCSWRTVRLLLQSDSNERGAAAMCTGKQIELNCISTVSHSKNTDRLTKHNRRSKKKEGFTIRRGTLSVVMSPEENPQVEGRSDPGSILTSPINRPPGPRRWPLARRKAKGKIYRGRESHCPIKPVKFSDVRLHASNLQHLDRGRTFLSGLEPC